MDTKATRRVLVDLDEDALPSHTTGPPIRRRKKSEKLLPFLTESSPSAISTQSIHEVNAKEEEEDDKEEERSDEGGGEKSFLRAVGGCPYFSHWNCLEIGYL